MRRYRHGNALPQRKIPNEQDGWERVHLGAIRYIDYATASFPPSNLYYPYVHKRLSFAHENELRAATIISQDAINAAAAGPTPFEISEAGIAIPVNLEMLIEAVHISPLAPPWFERVATSTLNKFGVALMVTKSALAEDPIY